MVSPQVAKFSLLGSLGAADLLSVILVIISLIDVASINHSAISLGASTTMVFNAIGCFLILAISGLGWYGGLVGKRGMLMGCGLAMILPALGKASNFRLLTRLDDEVDKQRVVEELDEKYKVYGVDPAVQATIDTMQSYYECCGSDKPKEIGGSFPASCCKNLSEDGKCTEPFKEGCADTMKADVLSRLFIEGIFGTMLFLSVIMVIITAFVYRRVLRRLQA